MVKRLRLGSSYVVVIDENDIRYFVHMASLGGTFSGKTWTNEAILEYLVHPTIKPRPFKGIILAEDLHLEGLALTTASDYWLKRGRSEEELALDVLYILPCTINMKHTSLASGVLKEGELPKNFLPVTFSIKTLADKDVLSVVTGGKAGQHTVGAIFNAASELGPTQSFPALFQSVNDEFKSDYHYDTLLEGEVEIVRGGKTDYAVGPALQNLKKLGDAGIFASDDFKYNLTIEKLKDLLLRDEIIVFSYHFIERMESYDEYMKLVVNQIILKMLIKANEDLGEQARELFLIINDCDSVFPSERDKESNPFKRPLATFILKKVARSRKSKFHIALNFQTPSMVDEDVFQQCKLRLVFNTKLLARDKTAVFNPMFSNQPDVVNNIPDLSQGEFYISCENFYNTSPYKLGQKCAGHFDDKKGNWYYVRHAKKKYGTHNIKHIVDELIANWKDSSNFEEMEDQLTSSRRQRVLAPYFGTGKRSKNPPIILRVMEEGKRYTTTELKSLTNISQGSVHAAFQSLIDDGYVTEVPVPKDYNKGKKGRKPSLMGELSEKGVELKNKIPQYLKIRRNP